MPAEPAFRSKPNTFRIAEGGSTMLPCFVDNLGKFYSIFHKEVETDQKKLAKKYTTNKKATILLQFD